MGFAAYGDLLYALSLTEPCVSAHSGDDQERWPQTAIVSDEGATPPLLLDQWGTPRALPFSFPQSKIAKPVWCPKNGHAVQCTLRPS